ncbi:hypothetical protein BGS_1281 [Beggiatoa sp. SS]|nr:hypothetical protein BGS_1281 [Beggiatoa sp. SS]
MIARSEITEANLRSVAKRTSRLASQVALEERKRLLI